MKHSLINLSVHIGVVPVGSMRSGDTELRGHFVNLQPVRVEQGRRCTEGLPIIRRSLHLATARRRGLRIDAVVADVDEVGDIKQIEAYTREIGASLLLSKLAADESSERHDPVRLAEAYRSTMGATPAG